MRAKSKKNFKETLTADEVAVFDIIRDKISSSFPDYTGMLTNHFYALKRTQDNFISFWFTKNENDEFVMKNLKDRNPDAVIQIRVVDLDKYDSILRTIRDRISYWDELDKPETLRKERELNKALAISFINSVSIRVHNRYTDFLKEGVPYNVFRLNATDCDWFVLSFDGSSGVLLSYRNLPDETNEIQERTFKFDDEDKAFNFICELIDKHYNKLTGRISFLNIFSTLKKLLCNQLITPSDYGYMEIASEVADSLHSIASQYPFIDLMGTGVESPNKYVRLIRKLNYCGYSGMTKNEAHSCFAYFVANKLFDCINNYENMLHDIISDKSDLLNSLTEMLETGIINFDKCRGVTTNFVCVPIASLDEILSRYIEP